MDRPRERRARAGSRRAPPATVQAQLRSAFALICDINACISGRSTCVLYRLPHSKETPSKYGQRCRRGGSMMHRRGSTSDHTCVLCVRLNTHSSPRRGRVTGLLVSRLPAKPCTPAQVSIRLKIHANSHVYTPDIHPFKPPERRPIDKVRLAAVNGTCASLNSCSRDKMSEEYTKRLWVSARPHVPSGRIDSSAIQA